MISAWNTSNQIRLRRSWSRNLQKSSGLGVELKYATSPPEIEIRTALTRARSSLMLIRMILVNHDDE